MEKVCIIPIGAVDSNILDSIASALRQAFSCEVEAGRETALPHNAYNEKRGQYNSTVILRKLRHFLKSKDFDRILGVIDKDIYVPRLNFVFGEADISRGVALISLARLREEFYGLPPDKGIFSLRAIKEAIHELGHTYGMDHCSNPECIMYFSNSIRDTDLKGPGFCNICRVTINLLCSR